MQSADLAKTWALVAGAILVLVGILGFFPNPIVGGAPGALVATDALHNIVHLGTGVVALVIYSLSSGDARKSALIGFGALYAAVFVLVLISPSLFGLFAIPANGMDHLIHAALAALTLGIAFLARGSYAPVRA